MRDCETCIHDGEKCAVMETPPKEFFCWADKDKRLKTEIDILDYAVKHSSLYDALNAVKRVINLRSEK